MARKNKKTKVGSAHLAAMAERELDKGNPKQALKHAKACYRLDRSEPTRVLLQRAFLFRGKELHARSMFENARSIIVEMDDLGAVGEQYKDDVVRLRALLGVGGCGTDGAKVDGDIQRELADQAVVFGPGSVTQSELQSTARNVREALEVIEANEPDRALELVAAISRDSPFADWKLLVRGLAAYYDEDQQRMRANWSRLAPARAAKRIADTLSVVAGQQIYSDATRAIQLNVDQLVHAVEGSIVGGLKNLQRKMRDADCEQDSLRAEVRRFMNAYARSEPNIAQRVTAILVNATITDHDTDADDLARMQRLLPKLPLDPHLNRAFALMHELLNDLYQTERYWKAYVEDLRTCPALDDSQRSSAIALVYRRLAGEFVASAAESTHSPLRDFDADGSQHEMLMRAESYLSKSCEADSTILDVQLQRLIVLESMGEKTEAAASFLQLAKRFPDSFDVLVKAAEFFIRNDQPAAAEPHATAAQVLRPRNESASTLLWMAAMGTAREAARVGQIRIAQDELDKAEKMCGPDRPTFIVLSMRAAVAFKDGNVEQGEMYLQQVIEKFEDPAAALLIVHSQTIRSGVTGRERLANLKDGLAEAMKRRKKSCQAAAVMAGYVDGLQLKGVQYRGMATHTKQVKTYLEKSVTLKWSPCDLVACCRFAMHSQELPLLTKLAKRGCKLFAKHPYFHFCLGEAQVMRGPNDCNFAVAAKALNKAIELNNTGDIKLETSDCQEAGKSLSLLDHGRPPRYLDRFAPFQSDDEDNDAAVGNPNLTLEMILKTLPPELAAELDEQGVSREDAAKAMAKMLGVKLN